MTLARLRARVETLLEAIGRARLRLLGEGAGTSAVGEVYLRQGDLFRQDRISEVQHELSAADGEEAKRIRYLLEFLAFGRGECAAAAELDRLVAWERSTTVEHGDRAIPVAAVPSAISAEPDPAVRRRLDRAWLDAVEDRDPWLEDLLSRRRDAVEEVGYGSYVVACEVLSGIDLRKLAREGEAVLADTESLYAELLGWFLPRVAGVERAEGYASDALRLSRAPAYDVVFPEQPDAVLELLAQSGLDPLAGGRVRVGRGSALGAARFVPLRVPDEVVLVAPGRPGRGAHATMLRAAGLGMHAAYTAPELELEYRWLGDDSVPLAFGALYEGLLGTPAVLARRYGLAPPEVDELRRYAAAMELLRLRRWIARLRYEVEQADLPPDERGARYAELMSQATGLRHDAREAVASVHPTFWAAREVRAAQLSALLAEVLRERYDEDWYRNPRSAPGMREWFAAGRRYSASELAVQHGAALSFEAPLRRLREMAG